MSRVLVFEDDPDLGALFRLLLEGQGHEVVSVACLSEAQALLKSQALHLILIEVPANLLDRRVLTTWRESLCEAAPPTPAILCSSAANITRTSAVVAGYEGYLPMPFDLDEAQAEIARVLAEGPVMQRGSNGYSCQLA